MSKLNFIFVLILNLCACSVASQEGNSPGKVHLQNLAQYRSQLLLSSQEELKEFHKVIDKLSLNDFESEVFKEMLYKLIADKKVYDYSNETILRFFKKDFPNIKFREELTLNDIEVISENSEILESILDGVLKRKYPFSLDVNTSFFDEFYFYKIDSTDIVGEIGAGLGNFSVLVSALEPQIELFVNEINKKNSQYIEEKFKNQTDKKVKIILGNKKSANFPLSKFDKIIIRNSFHHFKYKKNMLHSIKESLKADGVLYLNEPTTELSSDTCKKILPENEVITKIIENGFTLEETKEFGERLLLKFTITNK